MLGLRTQESDKFLAFWEIVQTEAKRLGKCFFLDCGDGNVYEDGTIECENLIGWLIDDAQKSQFDEVFSSNGDIGDEWADNIVFAKWEQTSDGFSVKFE